MKDVIDLLASFPSWSMDHVNGLIALGALALSALTIFVVFALASERRKP